MKSVSILATGSCTGEKLEIKKIKDKIMFKIKIIHDLHKSKIEYNFTNFFKAILSCLL